MEKTNLLKETQDFLAEHGRKLSDVCWIANGEGMIEVARFVELATQTYYDAGYGVQYIDPKLVIVGRSWWIARYEYDGKEGWVYHQKPPRPTLKAVNPCLMGNSGLHSDSWRIVRDEDGE